MNSQQRNEIIQKLEALAKEQTETHKRQMARIKNLVKVLENPNQSPKTRERFTKIFKLANAIIKSEVTK